MTRLWNDPADFADEMIAGFVAANERYVRRVPGGVDQVVAAPDRVGCRAGSGQARSARPRARTASTL